jgi:hypothetical protein
VQVTKADVPTCVGVIHVIDAVITRTDDGSASLGPVAGPLVNPSAASAPAGTDTDSAEAGATTSTDRGADALQDAARAAGALEPALSSLAAVVLAGIVL